MYNSFYNLISNPFGETPNTQFFFNSKSQTQALREIAVMLDHNRGLGIITGPVGIGKTILCRAIMKICGGFCNTGLILYPKMEGLELLRAVSEELGIPKSEKNRSYFYQKKQLQQHLTKNLQNGRKTLLIIDEAQHLSLEAFEFLRILNNLEFESKKLLHILICGQPELELTLNTPELAHFNQRLSLQLKLEALNDSEVVDYINHRLHTAGAENFIRFNSEAVSLIIKYSNNIPRLINSICRQALEDGETLNKRIIDSSIIKISLNKHPQIDINAKSNWLDRIF